MKQAVLIAMILFIYGCFGKKPTMITGHEGKRMPSINLLSIDSSTQINVKEVTGHKPTVLFYFSPHCPYCRSMTTEIIHNIKSLMEINFCMLSNFPLDHLKSYSREYNLQNYSNIIIGQDYEVYFSNYFKAAAVPCLAIYNKDGILKGVFMGKVSINLIKDIAFE